MGRDTEWELQSGIQQAVVEKLAQQHGGTLEGFLGPIPVHLIRVPEGAEDALSEALSMEPDVEFVEKDKLLPLSMTVSDSMVGNQWHLTKISAPSAWDVTNGSAQIIAILDTGMYSSHADLAANILPGWNSVSNTSDSSEILGHGTSVAGTAAAVGSNGIGVASVAWGAKILLFSAFRPRTVTIIGLPGRATEVT